MHVEESMDSLTVSYGGKVIQYYSIPYSIIGRVGVGEL